MSTQTQTKESPPVINGLTAKIGTIERRIEHLERRIENRSSDYASSASADFDRAEIAALKAAIACMRTHGGAVHAKAVLFYRGSGTDLATDIKAVVTPHEIARMKGAL